MFDEQIFDIKELSYWLAFHRLEGTGLGIKKVEKLVDVFGTAQEAWQVGEDRLLSARLLSQESVSAFIAQRKTIDADRLMTELADAGIDAYPYPHPCYPQGLRHIHDPPMVLFMKGGLHPDNFISSAAVVGTRRSTAYGRREAKRFAGHFAAAGVTVVSGMAAGIDSVAHEATLEVGGKTAAVLASGLDICYPHSNRGLFERIQAADQNSAILSEYFPGTEPEKWRFPSRNRIISGLSQAVLVVEAGKKSGANITAKLGFEQNRQVYAIPGRLNNLMSEGANTLIRDNYAKLITDPAELMRDMGWYSAKTNGAVPAVVQLFGREQEVFDSLSSEPMHFDHLCEKLSIGAGELAGALTMLELAGIVERHPGEWFSRNS